MPRGITGVYTLPQPAFVAGTTILSGSVNSDFSDIATALTQSLATTGVSSMTGPIKAFAGTEAAPGITWASDIDTGFYLSSGGVTTYTSQGADVFDMSALGISLLVGEFIDKTGQVVRPLPIGCAMDWPPNANPPDGWLSAYGQTELIASFPDLASVYSTTYGGDGITTFGIPDYRGRNGIGRDNMGGAAANRVTTAGSGIDGVTIAAVGGNQNKVLVVGNMPTGNILDVTLPQQNLALSSGSILVSAGTSGQQGGSNTSGNPTSLTANLPLQQLAGVITGAADTAVQIMNPSIVVNKIIYHGVFS